MGTGGRGGSDRDREKRETQTRRAAEREREREQRGEVGRTERGVELCVAIKHTHTQRQAAVPSSPTDQPLYLFDKSANYTFCSTVPRTAQQRLRRRQRVRSALLCLPFLRLSLRASYSVSQLSRLSRGNLSAKLGALLSRALSNAKAEGDGGWSVHFHNTTRPVLQRERPCEEEGS